VPAPPFRCHRGFDQEREVGGGIRARATRISLVSKTLPPFLMSELVSAPACTGELLQWFHLSSCPLGGVGKNPPMLLLLYRAAPGAPCGLVVKLA